MFFPVGILCFSHAFACACVAHDLLLPERSSATVIVNIQPFFIFPLGVRRVPVLELVFLILMNFSVFVHGGGGGQGGGKGFIVVWMLYWS